MAFTPVALLAVLVVGLVVAGLVVGMHRRGDAVLADDSGLMRRRLSLRYSGGGMCALLAALYAAFAFVVRAAETDAAVVTDTTWGAYLMVALSYLLGTVLLAMVDLRPLWVVGALVQIGLLAAFVVLGLGEGGYQYAVLAEVPLTAWAAPIITLQVVLLGLLTYLAATPTGRLRPTTPWSPHVVSAP